MKEFLMFLVTSILLLLLCIYMIKKRYNCKKEIQAKFDGHDSVYSKVGRQYSPIFCYKYNGVSYREKALEFYGKRKANKFVKGKTYSVFINENKPKDVFLTRRVSFTEILCILLGIFFIFSAVVQFISLYD